MEIKDYSTISMEERTALNKATQAIDKNNLEYAIEILKNLVIRAPGFIQAREKLRFAEKMQAKPGFLASIKLRKIVKTAQIDFYRGKYMDAMCKVEEALAIDVKNLGALKLLADIGNALSAGFIAIESYELACGFYPENPELMKLLAGAYRRAGKGKEELKLRKKLASMFPGNFEYMQEFRSAGALAAIEKDSTGELVSSFRDKLKSSEESAILEQKAKIIHSIDDIKDLVVTLEEKLKAEPDSMVIIRDLAWAYYKAECYEQALVYFKKLQDMHEHFDLASDKAIENIEIYILDKKIETLLKVSEKFQEVEDLKQEKINIKKSYAEQRVKLYPNDLQLHYELAFVYWSEKNYDKAIDQFQKSQHHPKWSFSSQLHLGLCFYEKKHYELAIDQLQKVISDENASEKELLEPMYFLGLSFEKLNDIANAKKYFKKVYSVNARYNDISEKIKKYYGTVQK